MVSNFNSQTKLQQLENFLNTNEIYPTLEDLATGFSFVLHAKIIEDFESKSSTKSPISEILFNSSHLSSYLNSDLKDVPPVNDIFLFTFNLFHSISLSEECLMLTLMYILRVLKATKIKIFANNWQIIVAGATLASMRVCDRANNCNLQSENFFTELSFDDIFELDSEFSRLMEYKYEVDLSFFERCFELLAYTCEEKSKKWKLNLEKIDKIIRRSKTFGEVEDESIPRIIRSKRIYNIDLDQFGLDN